MTSELDVLQTKIAPLLAADKIHLLYKAPELNNKGAMETLASFLLAQGLTEKLTTVKRISRRESYRTESHAKFKRGEEHLARVLLGWNLGTLGEVIDYQVPLKSRKLDRAGKIDVLSLCRNGDGGILNLIELKTYGNQDSLLRAVLEIATYARTIDSGKLLRDYGLTPQCVIRACVLAPPGCRCYEEMGNRNGNRWVHDLAKGLKVDLFQLAIDPQPVN